MKWAVAVAVLAILAFGLWWTSPASDSWRYKMTVEVETPEGVKTGSAVREVTYRGRTGFFLADGRPQWRVLGEAVAVDLPGGRTLYALLAGNDRDVDYGARIPDRAYSDDGRIHGPPPPVQLYPKAPDKGVFRITDPLPMLVMFADPKDSKSIMRIDPRNLSGTFGPGYALKSITLQMTDETVTREIEKRLPNFGKGSGFDRWYVGLSMDDPRRLTFDDFVKRGRK